MMPFFNFIKQEVRPAITVDLKVDPTFRKVPKHATTFAIWKIENDRLDSVPKLRYGTFHDSCAYIVYASTTAGNFVNQNTITREQKSSSALERFLHFWLGSAVTEQNRSNVAAKVQELDSYLGNVATIYRETQNHESARFLSYFKNGFDVRCSALSNSTSTTRLYWLFGRKWLRCIELPDVSWSYFNADHIMILKTEAHIFVWIGRSSSSIERRNAIERADTLKNDNVELIIVDDGYEQSMPDAQKRLWNAILPLNQRVVNQPNAAALTESDGSHNYRIYKCTHRGRLYLDQLDVLMPTKDDLQDSSSVYVLDTFGHGVWLWVGNQVPQEERLQAMGNGRAFVKKKKYPNSTLVVRIVEGHEPNEFEQLFPSESLHLQSTHKSPYPKLGKLDALALCQRPKLAADTQLIDDGSGERTLYRVTKEQALELPKTKAIIFTTNNSYVVNYTIACASSNHVDLENVGVKTIIYQWNGSEASIDAVKKAEQYARSLFDNLKGKAMFVQLCEFEETPHFLQIFEGKLIVLQGNKKTLIDYDSSLLDIKSSSTLNLDTFLLQVYGDASYNSKAFEVYPPSALCSKWCYIIRTNLVWIWCGQSSTGDAREVAKSIGALLGECSLQLEGKECKEFWSSIEVYFGQPLTVNGSTSSSSSSSLNGKFNGNGNSNGNGLYSNGSYIANNAKHRKVQPKAQLLLAWAQQDRFHYEEIYGYEQNDLHSDCVYILDAGTLFFIWLGEHTSNYEKESYLLIGRCYLDSVRGLRRSSTALAVVKQHDEPNVFKGFFNNWNNDLWQSFVSYDKKRQRFVAPVQATKLTNGCENGDASVPSALLNSKRNFDRQHKYPIAMLQQDMDSLPPEINPLKREMHLTHDDFVSVFNMSFWEFEDLPGWRQKELKKKNKLF